MTDAEPMSTPDSGGLREAVEALAGECERDGLWLIRQYGPDNVFGRNAGHLLRALLAAHPERIPHDDRLITCPECRSTFEAEDGSVVHMLVAPDSADDANRAPVSGGLDEGEREALAWAEMVTHQECAAKKHPDWFIDSEHNILCPWCRAEAAEAERDTARREAGEAGAKALRDAADELWGPSYTGGIQWGRTDYVGWLRARADALISDDGSGA